MAATSLSWHPLSSRRNFAQNQTFSLPPSNRRVAFAVRAFRRSDFDRFAKRVANGDAWRDAWRTANDGFEQFVFDARKAAEQLDRRYSLSRRLSSAARSAAERALQLDRELEGDCPACKRQFMGYKNQVVTCMGCGNIVWQPQQRQQPQQGRWDFFSRGTKRKSSQSKSDPEIIDVEFEEK